jgi:hypothetical protein
MAANLLVIGAFAFVIGFVVASAHALYKWQGFWRWLALIPVAVMTIVVLRILVQPEAHNLWPFEILLWCTGCAFALAALSLARRTYSPA